MSRTGSFVSGRAALGPLVVQAAKATEESYTLAVSGAGSGRAGEDGNPERAP